MMLFVVLASRGGGMMVMPVAVVPGPGHEGFSIRLFIENSLSLRGRVGVGSSLVSGVVMFMPVTVLTVVMARLRRTLLVMPATVCFGRKIVG